MQPFFMAKNYLIKLEGEFGWETRKQAVAAKLQQNEDKAVEVKCNSYGGSIDHGLGIMNLFKEHGDVTCYLYEFNASATTVAIMGAKKIVMEKNSFFLIHKVSNFVLEWGQMNADDIDAAISRLQQNREDNNKIDEVLVGIYAKKTNLPVTKIMDLMREGAWLNAQECLDYGFVDELFEAGDSTSKVNHLSKKQVDKFNSAGVPLPPLPIADESLVDRIIAGVSNLLSPKNDSVKPIVNMNKEFIKVNALLNVEAVEVCDGKVNLTVEQLTALNSALSDKDNAAEELEKENKELKEQVAHLKETPGSFDSEPDGISDSVEVISSAKELYNKVKKY